MGLTEHPLDVPGASWIDTGAGSLAILPYDEVRERDDPETSLVAFYEAAYRAGATAGGWDVRALSTRFQPHRERES